MNKAVLKHKIEKFVSDNISNIRKLHHNEFSTRKLKVNYINRTRGKKQSETKREWLPFPFLDKVCEYSFYIIIG
jgi:hypothetical protein